MTKKFFFHFSKELYGSLEKFYPRDEQTIQCKKKKILTMKFEVKVNSAANCCVFIKSIVTNFSFHSVHTSLLLFFSTPHFETRVSRIVSTVFVSNSEQGAFENRARNDIETIIIAWRRPGSSSRWASGHERVSFERVGGGGGEVGGGVQH